MRESRKKTELHQLIAKLLCKSEEKDALISKLIELKEKPFWAVVMPFDLEDSQILLSTEKIEYPLFVQFYLYLVRLAMYRGGARYLQILGDGGIGLIAPLFGPFLNRKKALTSACLCAHGLARDYLRFCQNPSFFVEEYKKIFDFGTEVKAQLNRLEKQLQKARLPLRYLPGPFKIGLACGKIRFGYHAAQGDMRDVKVRGPILYGFRARQVSRIREKDQKDYLKRGRQPRVFLGDNEETKTLLGREWGVRPERRGEICLDEKRGLYLVPTDVKVKRLRPSRLWEVVIRHGEDRL